MAPGLFFSAELLKKKNLLLEVVKILDGLDLERGMGLEPQVGATGGGEAPL
jgi:hypothetical protein